MAEDIKKAYTALAKKFTLPSFADMDKEFEVSKIDSDAFLLREIRIKIMEKLEYFTKVLEEQLQPEGASLAALHESSVFNEEEKKQLYTLFKKFMLILRKGVELSLENDDKETAVYITKSFNQWKDLKKELLLYVVKLKDSWAKDIDHKEELGYFG